MKRITVKLAVVMLNILAITPSVFALENGKYTCETHYENEYGTGTDSFSFEVSELYIRLFEDGEPSGLLPINTGWFLESRADDEFSQAYLITNDEKGLKIIATEAPFDMVNNEPIEIDEHYKTTTEFIEGSDGTILMISKNISPKYPEENGSTASVCLLNN